MSISFWRLSSRPLFKTNIYLRLVFILLASLADTSLAVASAAPDLEAGNVHSFHESLCSVLELF